MKDRIPKTTPSPTPLTPSGADVGSITAAVLPGPAWVTATMARIRKITTSAASRARSMLTDALMLRADSPSTSAIAARLKMTQDTSAWKVSST